MFAVFDLYEPYSILYISPLFLEQTVHKCNQTSYLARVGINGFGRFFGLENKDKETPLGVSVCVIMNA